MAIWDSALRTALFDRSKHRLIARGFGCSASIPSLEAPLNLTRKFLQPSASRLSMPAHLLEQLARALNAHGLQMFQQKRHGIVAAAAAERTRLGRHYIHIAHRARRLAYRLQGLHQAAVALLLVGHVRGDDGFEAACPLAQFLDILH